MKKQFTIFIIAFFIVMVVFCISKAAYATSGACSSHGGVNCSKGWQADGTVYCNDNWTDSTVYYNYMVECRSNEIAQECIDYINSKDEYLNKLDTMITNFGSQMAYTDTSDPNVAQRAKNYSNYLYTLRDRQIKRYYDLAKICTNDLKLKEQQYLKNKPYLEKQQCELKTDYIYLNNKCITHTEDCKKIYGENVYGSKGNNNNSFCYCLSGYEWNGNQTSCIRIITNTENDKSLELNSNTSVSDKKIIQCENGYALSLNKTKCIKIPEHAHAVDNSTDVWLCDEGYKEIENSCISIDSQEKKENIDKLTTNNSTKINRNLLLDQIIPRKVLNPVTTETIKPNMSSLLSETPTVETTKPTDESKNSLTKPAKSFFSKLFNTVINWFKK